MMALCGACGSVFDIDSQRGKSKRRKVQRPDGIQEAENGALRLRFRTNFRLDKSESFINSAILSGVFSLITVLMTGLVAAGEVPFFLPIIFSVMAICAIYSLATITYNATEILADEHSLRVSRGPLPSLTQAREISLLDVDELTVEETLASQERGYDTPRYHVWAQVAGGRRRFVVGDLTEDYAYYVAGKLNAFLELDDAPDTSRLTMTSDEADEEFVMVEEKANDSESRYG